MRALFVACLALGAPAAAHAQCYMAREGSPYDFTPGGGTLYANDFSGDPLGDFPASLEFKEGAMEVARWNGRNALKASAPSAFVIPLSAPLPESFTVEIGVVNRNTRQVGAETIVIYGGRSPNSGQGTVRAEYGTVFWQMQGGGANASSQFGSDDADVCIGQETTVRLKVDGNRVRLYADERRLASVPNAQFLRAPGLVVALGGRDDADNAVYVTSIRVAGGAGAASTASASGTTSPPPAAPLSTAQPVTTTTLATTPSSGVAPTGAATTAKAPPGAIAESPRTAAPSPLAPTNVRATPLSHGAVWVRWDPMPGATGYYIVRWLPDGKYIGANPLVRPEYGATDTAGATMQLNNGPVALSVIARYDDAYSPPSDKVTTEVPRWWGKYRISVLGFRVDRETRDDPMQTDGKRDEVFVRAAVAERGADAELVGAVIERQTFVYGDVNYSDWQNASSPNYRLRAGSASALGGLMTGDEVPKAAPWQRGAEASYDRQLPLLLWEGDLHQGRHQIQVALSIWETDQRPGTNVSTFGANSPERAAIDAAAAAARRLEVEQTGAIIAAVSAGVLSAPAVLPLLALSAPALAGSAAIAAVAYGASEVADDPMVREITPRVPLVLDASSPLDQLNTAIANSPLAKNPLSAAVNDANSVTRLALDSAIAWAATTVNTAFGTAFLSSIQQLGLTLNVKDRPIGLRKQGSTLVSPPWILTLSFENIEGHALMGNGPANLGPGVYAMQFRDDPLTFGSVDGGDGVYTLYVQVQRLY